MDMRKKVINLRLGKNEIMLLKNLKRERQFLTIEEIDKKLYHKIPNKTSLYSSLESLVKKGLFLKKKEDNRVKYKQEPEAYLVLEEYEYEQRRKNLTWKEQAVLMIIANTFSSKYTKRKPKVNVEMISSIIGSPAKNTIKKLHQKGYIETKYQKGAIIYIKESYYSRESLTSKGSVIANYINYILTQTKSKQYIDTKDQVNYIKRTKGNY